jgi:hypothetical protein
VLRLGFFQNGMSRSVSWAGVLPPNGCKQITLINRPIFVTRGEDLKLRQLVRRA